MRFSVWTKRNRKWHWLSFSTKEESAKESFDDYCRPEWKLKDIVLLKDNGIYPSHIVSEKVLLENGKIIERKEL